MLKLFRLIKPHRGYVAIILVLALAQSIGVLLLPRLMSDIVDKGMVKGDQRAILQTGVLMLLTSIVATLCAIAGSYYSSQVATGFGRILRGAIFARVEHFSLHQFDRFSSASLVTRTTNDTTQVQMMVIMLLTMVITAPMMAIGGILLAVSQDVQLAWVLIAVMPVMAVVFGVILRGAIPLSQAIQKKIDRLNEGTMQVGAMIASLQYAMQILFAVFMVTAMFVMLPRASAAADRINEVLDLAPEIVDPATPVAPQVAARRGHVVFDNVTFQYPGAEEPALA